MTEPWGLIYLSFYRSDHVFQYNETGDNCLVSLLGCSCCLLYHIQEGCNTLRYVSMFVLVLAVPRGNTVPNGGIFIFLSVQERCVSLACLYSTTKWGPGVPLGVWPNWPAQHECVCSPDLPRDPSCVASSIRSTSSCNLPHLCFKFHVAAAFYCNPA